MGWKVYGERLLTADLTSNLRVYQRVNFNSDIILKACRVWLIAYNDPSFTSLTMDIYSISGTTPKKLLHSSTNSVLKADMLTDTNGVKEIFFNFNSPTFKGVDTFGFVLRATGYTGTTSTHLAWKKAWPDPVYRLNVPVGLHVVGKSPYDIYFIGDEL
jgi:hypothetical protein